MTNSNHPFQLPTRDLGQGQSAPPRGGYQVDDPSQFSIQNFAKADNLNWAYTQLIQEGGPAAGLDGIRPADLSIKERWGLLRMISQALISGTYRPHPSRVVKIPRRDGRVRLLQLMRVTDRCVAKALLNCLTDFWSRQRISMSVWQVYRALSREIRRRGVYYLAIDDIRDCFPSAPLDEVIRCQRHFVHSEPLLQLIARVIRYQDGAGQTGLEQGSPYSPVAMDALLHHYLDRVMMTREQGRGILLRYVDNLTFICRNAGEGLRLVEAAKECLNPLNLKLKGQQSCHGDLRDQHIQTPLLGLIPRWENDRLTFKIPESAYNDLETRLQMSSASISPLRDAESCCKGWIEARSPALTNRVAQSTSHRISQLAVKYGFRSLTRSTLNTWCHLARRRWDQFLKEADSNPRET